MAAHEVRSRHPGPVVALVVALLFSGAISASAASSTPTQTSVEPPFGASLTSRMLRLTEAIVNDSPGSAINLFFPRAAYVAMKTGEIPRPTADYENRLVAFFYLDVGAYHRLLVGHPATVFIAVNANPRLAAWIPPGACENRVGYWHVPGVRLVVRRGHQTVSVAVDSLISWRGIWYVVHLGPNPRPRNVGTVDGFAVGAGIPGPGGGC